MRKLVQKIVDINPIMMNDARRLQEKINELSEDGWEYCGPIGMFHLFKRWEEETKVYQGEPYNSYSNPYLGSSPSYNRPYQPQPSYGYNPSVFGTPVYNPNNDKFRRPSDDD